MVFEQSFYLKTRTKVQKLVQAGFWSGINQNRFSRWCDEFKTPKEEALLAFLLDSLVYRSQNQISGLIHQMIDVNLSSAIDWKNLIDQTDKYETLFDLLSDKYPQNLRNRIALVPVIKINDPPTKSGPLLARIIHKHKINSKFMCWPWDESRLHDEELRLVVFFDDFVGTGDQFTDFFNYFNKIKALGDPKKVQYLYIAFSGTQDGITFIEENTANQVKVHVTETIKESNKFFSGFAIRYKKLQPFIDLSVNEYSDNLKSTYIDFMDRKGIRKEIFGYNDLELTHVFSHGTPNGTLPILWCTNPSYSAPFTR
ncbi:phosphoribosyltransferase-like protein [Acinetobacter sp. M5A5_2a]